MLKANGIAPAAGGRKRSAASHTEAGGVKQEIIEIDDEDDEIKTLEVSCRISFEAYLNKLRVTQNRLNVLKSRRSQSNGHLSKRVKREPRNPNSSVPGEVIDLT